MKILHRLLLKYWMKNYANALFITLPCLLTLCLSQTGKPLLNLPGFFFHNLIHISITIFMLISKNLGIVIPITLIFILLELTQKKELNLLLLNNIPYKKISNTLICISTIFIFFIILFNSLIAPKHDTIIKNFLQKHPVELTTSLLKKKRIIQFLDYLIYAKSFSKNSFNSIILVSPKNCLIAKKAIIKQKHKSITIHLTNVLIINKQKSWSYTKSLLIQKNTNNLAQDLKFPTKKSWNWPQKWTQVPYYILFHNYLSINWYFASLIILLLFAFFSYQVNSSFIICCIIFIALPAQFQITLIKKISNKSESPYLLLFLPTIGHCLMFIVLTTLYYMRQTRAYSLK